MCVRIFICLIVFLFLCSLSMSSAAICVIWPPTIVPSFPLRLSLSWKNAQLECRAVSMQKQEPSVCDSAVQMLCYWWVAPHSVYTLGLKHHEATTTPTSLPVVLENCPFTALVGLRLSAATQNRSAQMLLICLTTAHNGVCIAVSEKMIICSGNITVWLLYLNSWMHCTYNTTTHTTSGIHPTIPYCAAIHQVLS